MITYHFYDTCSLLLKANDLFNDPSENIVISSITLNELENIKTSSTKDPDIKYCARKLLHTLNENLNKFTCWIFKTPMLKPIEEAGLDITNDMKILACAIDYDTNVHPDATIFITNDLALKTLANLFFGEDSICSVDDNYKDDYDGYVERQFSDEELDKFYANQQDNQYGILQNQYLIIKDSNNQVVDSVRWTGQEFKHLTYSNFKSSWFGEVKPYKGDTYQQLLCDSFSNNKITMVKGPAGTGKSYLSLGFLMSALENHKIDKIIVFCNTIATKGAAKLGYYPGTKDEKLLDSQIGNLLASKFGDRFGVESLIQANKLLLLPCSDIRGFDTTGMKAGIYITEAQNMDINLLKLALQRIGEDGICVIDGDFNTQVDLPEFAGANNGMRRASAVFRGSDIYGEVTLKKIYRSKIAELADNM